MPHRNRIVAYVFVAPAFALIALFVLWPTASCVYTSIHATPLAGRDLGRFIALGNYADLLEDPAFARSVVNTVFFTLLVVPGQAGLALLLALWVNKPGWSRRIMRLCVFIPTAMSLTVLSVVWKLLYEPASATGAGLINGLLSGLALPGQPFLTSTGQAMPAIVVMSIWQGVGLQMVILLAALQAVPAQLYEASTLDGAGRFRRFWHVTLPGIAPTAALVVMITTILALKLFVQPFLMTRGGPGGSTMSIVQYIYEAAFYRRDLGLACAAGTLFFIMVSGVTGLLRWLSAKAEAMT